MRKFNRAARCDVGSAVASVEVLDECVEFSSSLVDRGPASTRSPAILGRPGLARAHDRAQRRDVRRPGEGAPARPLVVEAPIDPAAFFPRAGTCDDQVEARVPSKPVDRATTLATTSGTSHLDKTARLGLTDLDPCNGTSCGQGARWQRTA